MKIKASEISVGQRLIIKRGYQSYRIMNKVKETKRTITFLVKHYVDDIRCRGRFIEKEKTFRKSTNVESNEDFIGTKKDQLHRIRPERIKDVLERGLELYIVSKVDIPNYSKLEIGDYMFAKFNGANYETECILDDGCVNSIPPSKNSDKPQLSGWSNACGGFEDYYEKVDMDIL